MRIYWAVADGRTEIIRRAACLRRLVADLHRDGHRRLCLELDQTLRRRDNQILIEATRAVSRDDWLTYGTSTPVRSRCSRFPTLSLGHGPGAATGDVGAASQLSWSRCEPVTQNPSATTIPDGSRVHFPKLSATDNHSVRRSHSARKIDSTAWFRRCLARRTGPLLRAPHVGRLPPPPPPPAP